MSINHYSSDLTHPQWWPHYNNNNTTNNQKSSFICQLSPNPTFCNRNTAAAGPIDLNNDDDEDEHPPPPSAAAADGGGDEANIPKERLFEKPLTPSDVGKLNRLVIPKQHAEKHFPMGGGGGGEPAESGLLLGFEDENGKSWRFRYSYWNSSQSYVLTKGWSRFVKEKRLDAGDIVVFLRHRVDTRRLFIGWRRRNAESGAAQPPQAYPGFYSGRGYPTQHQRPGPSSLVHAGSVVQQNQTTTTTTTTGSSGNSKRLRLFGVNLECQLDESDEPVGSPMSSQGQTHHHHHPYYHQYYYSNHMDISFSSGARADVYRQG